MGIDCSILTEKKRTYLDRARVFDGVIRFGVIYRSEVAIKLMKIELDKDDLPYYNKHWILKAIKAIKKTRFCKLEDDISFTLTNRIILNEEVAQRV